MTVGAAVLAGGCASTPSAAICRVRVLVPESGDVEVAQIVESAGIVGSDRECLNAAVARHFDPYTLGGMPVDRWVTIPFALKTGVPVSKAEEFKNPVNNPLPIFIDQDFDVGASYYPAEALAKPAEGVCGMQITVSAAGEVDEIRMIRSTGVAALDLACEDAMYAARLKPALREGKPITAVSEVALAWRLPKHANFP